METIKKGTYRWKEASEITRSSSAPAECNIPFSIKLDEEMEAMLGHPATLYFSGFKLSPYTMSGVSGIGTIVEFNYIGCEPSTPELELDPGYITACETLGSGWYMELYREVTIENDVDLTSVVGLSEFVRNTDFISSGDPVDEGATVTYNGEAIATITSGQTATIKCKGKVMKDDIVITL